MPASSKIQLVQNDTRPRLVFNLTDLTTGEPFDISGTSPEFQFVAAGAAQGTIIATVPCTLMIGYKDQYGDLIVTPPLDVPGAGGRCFMDWVNVPPLALSASGEFQGALQVFFPDGSRQTVYGVQKFTVRPEF